MKINDWNLEKIDDSFLKKIKNEYKKNDILPEYSKIFRAYEITSLKNVKVVIFGQDPYPNKADANGLAFSVNRADKLPKSLQNIFKELYMDLGIRRKNGNLEDIARQGVLFLNTSFIVKQKQSNSYPNFGFEDVVLETIELLNKKEGVIFVLLGNKAKKQTKYIDTKVNHIICTSHPSPLSAYRGFFGSEIFSIINSILKKENKKIIEWKEEK